jgi:F-type H+-transporting ATPase subunit delta
MPQTVRQARRRARRLFRWCFVNNVLDESRVRHVVQGVLTFRRRGYISVLEEFRRLLKLEWAQHTARIESVSALPLGFRTRVQKSLESSYGAGVDAVFAQEPNLIAGIRIQIGSDVYDGSIRARLAAMAKAFGIDPARIHAEGK